MLFKAQVCIFGCLIVAVSQVASMPSTTSMRTMGLLDINKRNIACRNRTFCVKPHPNYPQKHIDNLIKEKFNLSLGEQHIDFRIRDGDLTYVDDDCSKYTYFDKVYEILDRDNQLRVVVQSPYFNQTVSLEECRPPTGHEVKLSFGTTHFDDSTLETYDIYCKQIEMKYKFIVLTIDGNDVEFVSPKNKLPVGCTARVR